MKFEIMELVMKNNKFKLYYVIVIAIMILIIVNSVYLLKFNNGLANNSQEFANYGAYLGGVLGSVFSLLSTVLLVLSLQEQKESSKKQIELIQNQVDDIREQTERQHTYEELKSETDNLSNVLYSRIDPGDLFLFVKNNTEDVYRKYFTNVEGSNNSYQDIMSNSEEKFIECNSKSTNQTYINFINSLRLSGLDYSKIYIPKNIHAKTNKVILILSDIRFLSKEYCKYVTAHVRLASLLRNAYSIVSYFNESKITNYNTYMHGENLYHFFFYIINYEEDSFYKYPNIYFRESMYRLIKKNSSTFIISERSFIYNYIIEYQGDKIVYKNYHSDDWEGEISIVEISNII
jgi:hypothetical protein